MSTGIQWTDETWNPIRGCSRVSEGCRHCYAEVVAARFSGPGQAYEGLARRISKGEARWTGKIMFVEKHLLDPLRWKEPRRIFVNSMSDLFHEKVTDLQLDRIFAVMCLAQRHTFQVLTKRPERMRDYIRSKLMDQRDRSTPRLSQALSDVALANGLPWPLSPAWPPRNVWLGVSVENQEAADERIPILLDTPAAIRFLSVEPLLDRVSFRWAKWEPFGGRQTHHLDGLRRLDWVIVGGESGSDARPCYVGWIREIVEQCAEAKVPCFVKQMGKWITGDHAGQGRPGFDTGFVVNRWLFPDGSVFVPPIIGAHAHDRPANAIAFGCCDNHGGNWIEWPRDLRVREFPTPVLA